MKQPVRCVLRRSLTLSALAVGLWATSWPIAHAQCDLQREIAMGKEAAAEVEKDRTLVSDKQTLDRLARIGNEIAEVANSMRTEAAYGSPEVCRFEYTFRVLEDDDVNAFALPGGFIYLNTGLIKYVQSDHELAGVLAHEIAHAAHHHMVCLVREQSRMDGKIAVLLLAGMLSKMETADLGNVLMGAQLVKIARISGYGQKAELDADRTAVEYLAKTSYNPVGLLTFIERLAHDNEARPPADMGILQTHPPSRSRARNIAARIAELGLPLDRRSVVAGAKADLETCVEDGEIIAGVRLYGKTLFRPATLHDGTTSEQRAAAIARKVNELLDSGIMIYQIRADCERNAVTVKGEPIIIVTDEDAALEGRSAPELTRQAAAALKQALWRQYVERIY